MWSLSLLLSLSSKSFQPSPGQVFLSNSQRLTILLKPVAPLTELQDVPIGGDQNVAISREGGERGVKPLCLFHRGGVRPSAGVAWVVGITFGPAWPLSFCVATSSQRGKTLPPSVSCCVL